MAGLAVTNMLPSQPIHPASKQRAAFVTAIVQLRNVVQQMAMSTSQAFIIQNHHTTPPSSFAERPLTPPPTDEKRFSHVRQVLRLFTDIRAGRHVNRGAWAEFQLAEGEYDEIERRLEQDEALLGYVKDKIRWVYTTGGRRCG